MDTVSPNPADADTDTDIHLSPKTVDVNVKPGAGLGPTEDYSSYTFAVIGGGIAAVSCVEQILEFDPEANILLISASPVVKEASQVTRIGKTLEEFIVLEKTLKSFKEVHQSVRVVQGEVTELRHEDHLVVTKNGERFHYRKLCICTGASPKILFPGWEHVVGIRDTESVGDLAQKVSTSRRVLLIGNGGIATEFVHEVQGVDIVWAIKDDSISAHFVDPGAAEFFIQSKLSKESTAKSESLPTPNSSESVQCDCPKTSETSDSKFPSPSKRKRYKITSIRGDEAVGREHVEVEGSALGPDWHRGINLTGKNVMKNVRIVYRTECVNLRERSDSDNDDNNWKVFAELTNGEVVGCDLVISATGVVPNCKVFSACEQDEEKGIFVDSAMRTSAQDVFAAGDICFPNWTWSKHWFQMRLWTQARQMGLYAGKSMFLSLAKEDDPMTSEEIDLDFCFECFSHVTRFFGYKVVLLGLFNGQGLPKSEQHYLVRCTKNQEYIKVVLQNWRMQGAVLIGETGLEETFENLILNQIDLSPYGEDLLNPDIDIEDYFD